MAFKLSRKKKRIVVISLCMIAVSATIIFLLFFFGVLKFNNPKQSDYPVRGVDVSSYQGEIDWETLVSQQIQFAFIKATEGSSHTDPYFAENYKNAIDTNLRVGAYHFFSFESSGKTQAENFCNAVYSYDGMLPPVIDVEYYGEFKSLSQERLSQVKYELRICVDMIKDAFSMKPIIYAAEKSYSDLIGQDFSDCDLWIRNIFSNPNDDISWKFWQYTNRQILDGYNGEEKYIDMNVFNGTSEEFEMYGKNTLSGQ